MTWKTSKGERVLAGAEAKLFCSALATMIDMANDSGEGLNFGLPLVVGQFERLTMPQKYTVLEEVTHALLNETHTCPPLSAVNESAIYYVFQWLKQEFDDLSVGETVWGQLVLDAVNEDDDAELDEDEEASYRPTLGCMAFEKWEAALEDLADRILWDRDFEMEGDLAAVARPEALARLDIEEDYYKPFTGATKRGAKDRLYDMVRRVSG